MRLSTPSCLPGRDPWPRGGVTSDRHPQAIAALSDSWLAWAFACLLFSNIQMVSAPASTGLGAEVRPVLSANCFHCHGQDPKTRKANLRLDTVAGQRTNDVVVPGHPEKSELIRRIFTTDPEDQMPPPDAHRTLTAAQKELLRRWVTAGAPWQSHWAFVAPVRPAVPKVSGRTAKDLNPIDAFVRARLAQERLRPSPEADRITLLRRVTLDLIGLPPRPEEADAFLADTRPGAYERLVDRLLASPQYGERMALPWLDAARYADSNGFQQDGDTHQWVWRDRVVRALNHNQPFDQFSIEQLAGDLLPDATLDQKVASGFNRCHLLNGEGGAIAEEQRNVIVFDRVDVTATVWLGLTMACAQCHDHKYDPVTQRDYYRMFAYFNNVPESGVPGGSGQYRIADPAVPYGTETELAELKQLEDASAAARAAVEKAERSPETAAAQAAWESITATNAPPAGRPAISSNVLAIIKTPAAERRTNDVRSLREFFLTNSPPPALVSARDTATLKRKQLDEFRAKLPRVMVMSDAKPRQTRILERGNYEQPRDPVSAGTPDFLPPPPADAPTNRLGLARWLFSPEHPLTARVQVNRAWQIFFGQGLVRTSENLGIQSEPPSHPDLLDWLAVEFRESGWDVKHLHRLIVTSATYRQSSLVSRDRLARDPENRLLSRGPRFRLSSLLLRDLALASSGLLDPRIGGKPVYPYQTKDIWDGLAITKERDFTYPQSQGADLWRRSLYTFWRRTVAPGNMFDASARQVCKVRPSLTSTPLHALTMLNDVTWVEAGRALAQQVMHAHPRPNDQEARLTAAFRRVCTRPPAPDDLKILQRGLSRALAAFRADPQAAAAYLKAGDSPRDPALDPVEHAAYATVCLAIYNLDEAMTKQ